MLQRAEVIPEPKRVSPLDGSPIDLDRLADDGGPVSTNEADARAERLRFITGDMPGVIDRSGGRA